MPSFRYSHQKMRLVLTEYIASSGQVFTSAQHVRFEKFIQEYVQPEYSGVPLHTIRNDSMSLFNDMKRELIWDLSSFDGTFSFSTNYWRSADEKLGYRSAVPEFTATYDIMESKFESYWVCMLPSFCLAAAMGPRLKGCLDTIVTDMSEYLSMPLLNIDAIEARLHDLYKGYESKFAEKEDSTSDPMPRRKRSDDSDDIANQMSLEGKSQ
ncbi:hypothetical protein ACLB2K_028842 [Fragaria x ananassa]